jgi:uncharacterized protein (TIGR02145 family)
MNPFRFLLAGIFGLTPAIHAFGQETLDTSHPVVELNGLMWLANNFAGTTYLNGDPIPQAVSVEEWIDCADQGRGCWCYYENDASNSFGPKYGYTGAAEPGSFGVLYNGHALLDPRGFGLPGFRLPTDSEYNALIPLGSTVLKSTTGWATLEVFYAGCQCNGYSLAGNNQSGFNAKGSGYRERRDIYDDEGVFHDGFERAVFWCRLTSDNSQKLTLFGIDGYEDNHFWEAEPTVAPLLGDGYAVRLVRVK